MLSLNQEQYSNANSLQSCAYDNTTQNHKSKNITKPYNSDHLKTGFFFFFRLHAIYFETFMTVTQNAKPFW